MAEFFSGIRINIDGDLLNLADIYTAEARDILDSAGLELADELQQNSPEGATGDLKKSWDVIQATRQRNTLDVRFSVINRAPESLFRVVGRAPGRIPPFHEGSSIDQWVKEKQGVSDPKERKRRRFLIARGIAREGTKRWRDKENVLGLDPVSGEYFPDSPVVRKREEAIARIQAIQLPKKARASSRRRR